MNINVDMCETVNLGRKLLHITFISQSCVPVAPELRSGKNYDRWGPRNGLSQFLGAQELSSAAFRPTLTTDSDPNTSRLMQVQLC